MADNYLAPSEVATEVGLGRARIYALLERGTLRGIRVGGRWRVPLKEVEDLKDRLEEELTDLSLEEVAEELGVHRSTILKAIDRGEMPVRRDRLVGHGFSVPLLAYEAWKEESLRAKA